MARRFPPPRYPVGLVLRYGRAIGNLLAHQSRLITQTFSDPRWETMTNRMAAKSGLAPARDDELDDLDEAINAIRIQVARDQPDNVIEDLVRSYGKDVDDHNLSEFRRTFKAAIGVDLPGQAPHGSELMRQHTADGVRLIKTIRTGQLERVRLIVERRWRAGDRWEAIAANIRKETGATKTVANRIARDQVGKLNGLLARDRQLAVGVKENLWRTSKDGRVREKHRRLEGKAYDLERGHPTERWPGWPIQCRCYGEPVFEDEDGNPVGPLGEALDRSPFPAGIGGPTRRPRAGRGRRRSTPAADPPASPGAAPSTPGSRRPVSGRRGAPAVAPGPGRAQAPRATRSAPDPAFIEASERALRDANRRLRETLAAVRAGEADPAALRAAVGAASDALRSFRDWPATVRQHPRVAAARDALMRAFQTAEGSMMSTTRSRL